MNLNDNFSERASSHAETDEFVPSPMHGVERRMLDRVGDEVARATTIVRFAADAHFSEHTHGGGEEFLVLEGVFQDEHGDYPAGSYIRNPPTSHHTPRSDSGCTIFVKLWQFQPDDRQNVVLTKDQIKFVPSQTGIDRAMLFKDDIETVELIKLGAGETLKGISDGGVEILCLNGSFEESEESFTQQSWLRLADGAEFSIKASSEGAEFWMKTGHLKTSSVLK